LHPALGVEAKTVQTEEQRKSDEAEELTEEEQQEKEDLLNNLNISYHFICFPGWRYRGQRY
jgi:hypothetical protein